jgi:hypothetical protein
VTLVWAVSLAHDGRSVFVHYTCSVGEVLDFPAGASTWGQPATRAWFARAHWATPEVTRASISWGMVDIHS